MKKEKVTAQAVRDRLFELAEPDYRDFQQKLLPGTENILGVRLPFLRTLAKGLGKQDWEEWFLGTKSTCYEETLVRGLTIAYAKLEPDRRLDHIRRFVPEIDNWAVCDSFCNTLKEAEKYPRDYWALIEEYASSDQEYEARFAAVMLLSHFVGEEYLEDGIRCLESIHQEDYYAKMAVAWAVSVYFAAFPDEMLDYLQNRHRLDAFTYKKSLQKILESYRVDKETKAIIREMRQKG